MWTLITGILTAIMLSMTAWSVHKGKAKNKIGITALLSVMTFMPFLFFSSYSIKLGQLI